MSHRSKNAFYNVIASFSYEGVALICGLILPRLILGTFGSAYNGLTSSITQFISVIVLMKAGIGGVTRAALYKPLAERNSIEVSDILMSTEIFMRKIAKIFIGFIIVFAMIYPIGICDEFNWFFSFSLVLIISISTFIQYYYGLTYQLLLTADQKEYVVYIAQIVSTAVNTIISAVLIYLGYGIHIVQIGSTVAFALNPLIVNRYAYKFYHIDRSVKPNMQRLAQRWNAFGHEVANFINSNTDIMVLTIFQGVSIVSVYTVYAYVTAAVRKTVTNFVSGFGAAFGNMYARKEYELMRENLGVFVLIVFSITSVIYSVTLVMITPFVLLYTYGIFDISYNRPVFGVIITLAGAFSCFRIPYYTVTAAVGHYKQTRNGAFVEAFINASLSIAFVIKWGIVGVAIGSLVAALFRSTQYALYLGKNILKVSFVQYVFHVIVAISIMAVVYYWGFIIMPEINNVFQWLQKMLIFTIISCVLTGITDVLFWRKDVIVLLKKMRGIFKLR